MKPRTILIMALAVIAVNATAADWDSKTYNPHPLADDVVLPMPCGGAMAFRKVETEADGPLGDQKIRLGGNNTELGYIEANVETYVAGAFPGEGRASRYYLIGKYEVTERQYQAMRQGDSNCAALADSRLPQTQVNWFDAMQFADAYSQWLLNYARAQLPRDGDTPGFIRLPTEVEWEFAARGGRKLSVSAFEAPYFPMSEGMNAYVWYAGSDSSDDRRPRNIGMRQANPLGLHDILGNVDEIAFDLFHLTKWSRQHGQVGAFVVRGGNVTMPPDQIRASYRQEVPFYQGGQPLRAPNTGFRVAVSKPVIQDQQSLNGIRQEAAKLPKLETELRLPEAKPNAVNTPSPAAIDSMAQQLQLARQELEQCRATPPNTVVNACPDDPLSEVDAQSQEDLLTDINDLATKTQHPALRRRLGNIWAKMAALAERQQEDRSHAAREALRTAAMICLKLHDDYQNVLRPTQGIYQSRCLGSETPDLNYCAKKKVLLADFESKAGYNFSFYEDAVHNLAYGYSREILNAEKTVLLDQLAQEAYKGFAPFVERLYQHVATYQSGNPQERKNWERDCIDTVAK